MYAPTPLKPRPIDRRRNLALAWAMVGGIFTLGAICGGVAAAAAFLSALSN